MANTVVMKLPAVPIVPRVLTPPKVAANAQAQLVGNMSVRIICVNHKQQQPVTNPMPQELDKNLVQKTILLVMLAHINTPMEMEIVSVTPPANVAIAQEHKSKTAVVDV